MLIDILSVVILINVVILSAIKLNVVMLSVAATIGWLLERKTFLRY